MNWSYARKNKIKTICKWNEVFKEYQISRASNYHRVLIYYASALYYYYRQSDNLRDEGQCSSNMTLKYVECASQINMLCTYWLRTTL